MSTYHLPGKGIPAMLRRAAGLPPPGGSGKTKAARSLYDVIKMAQEAVKVYQDMLRSEEPSDSPQPPTDSPTEMNRLRQRSDKVWLALGLVGRDIVTDANSGAEVPTEEELRQAMREELRRGILERLSRILQTLLRWLNLYALFLSRFFFFEFPNNLRHLCTTMPWPIWPALVVLWGVCWMFYTPEADERGQNPAMPQQQFLSSATLGTASPSAPVEGASYTWYSGIDLSTPEQLRIDQTLPTLSPAPNYPSNGFAGGGQWSGTASPVPMFGNTTLGVSQSISQAPMALPIRPNGEVPTAALGLFPNSMASLQPMPTGQPVQEIKRHLAPTTMETPLTPPSGPTGQGNLTGRGDHADLTCPYCNQGVKNRADLKRHRDKHLRRHACNECHHAFGSKTDLTRHEDTIHGRGGRWICEDPACNRSGKPFTRKDNLTKHMRDVHKRPDYLAPLPAAGATTERQGTMPGAGTSEGRRRCGCNAQRENEALRREIDDLKRKKEAKKTAYQERERELKTEYQERERELKTEYQERERELKTEYQERERELKMDHHRREQELTEVIRGSGRCWREQCQQQALNCPQQGSRLRSNRRL